MSAISQPQTTDFATTLSTPEGVARLSGMHFFNYAARGLVLPFAALYLASVGFTGAEIGLVFGLRSLSNLLLSPVLNDFADRTGRHRHLYYVLIFITAFATFGLATPQSPLWLGAMVIVWSGADKSVVALQSQLTISWLKLRDREIFGRVRAWGSVGWGVMTFTAGTLLAIGGYPLMFIVSGLSNLVLLPLARVLPERTASKEEVTTSTSAPRQTGFYILLGAMFFFSVCVVSYGSFGFVYMEQALGADAGYIGVLVGVVALTEVGPMIMMDRLLRRVDVRLTLASGFAGVGLVTGAMALLDGPALLMPLMLVRGLMQTFFLISLPLLVSQISHPANLARNQSLAVVTVPGLAGFLSGPIAGIIYDSAGGAALMAVAGVIGIGSGVALLIVRRRLVPPGDTA